MYAFINIHASAREQKKRNVNRVGLELMIVML